MTATPFFDQADLICNFLGGTVVGNSLAPAPAAPSFLCIYSCSHISLL